MIKPVDETIKELETASLTDLLRLLDSPFSSLINIQVATILQHLPIHDQMIILACQVGAILADFEGRSSQYEKEGGELMTLDKHTRLFVATAHAAYRTCLDERIKHEMKGKGE